MDKRLFRNEHEKVIAGVSSGIAEYMEVDVTIIRLLFVLSTIFLVGTGILVYIIMWIVVPVNNDPTKRFSKFNEFYKGPQNNPFNSPNAFSQPFQNPVETPNPAQSQSWTSSTVNEGGFTTEQKQPEFKPYQKSDTGRTIGGLFLLVIGMYFLMNEFNIIPFWFSISKLWPLVFVAIGVSFILKSKRKDAWEEWKRQNTQNAPTEPVNPIPTDVPGDSSTGESKIDDRFTKKDI
jgi:phage shock protein PspC (stress-responsive transcriptional regulator)